MNKFILIQKEERGCRGGGERRGGQWGGRGTTRGIRVRFLVLVTFNKKRLMGIIAIREGHPEEVSL